MLPLLLLIACNKEEDLPATDYVMIKFVNKTGKDVENLSVSRASIGDLKKGSTSAEYFSYEKFGQQYGYGLVEAAATINDKRYLTGSACQGICDTPSAPHGTWLKPGYYKVSVHISNEGGGNYLVYKMMD